MRLVEVHDEALVWPPVAGQVLGLEIGWLRVEDNSVTDVELGAIDGGATPRLGAVAEPLHSVACGLETLPRRPLIPLGPQEDRLHVTRVRSPAFQEGFKSKTLKNIVCSSTFKEVKNTKHGLIQRYHEK